MQPLHFAPLKFATIQVCVVLSLRVSPFVRRGLCQFSMVLSFYSSLVRMTCNLDLRSVKKTGVGGTLEQRSKSHQMKKVLMSLGMAP